MKKLMQLATTKTEITRKALIIPGIAAARNQKSDDQTEEDDGANVD